MTHRSWFQSQNSLQLPTNLNKRIVCELKKGEKIIKNNCNDLTNFFVCFLHIISYKNVWDLSKKIVKTSWTFFVKIEVLTQIVRIIWCNLWCHIKHCAGMLEQGSLTRPAGFQESGLCTAYLAFSSLQCLIIIFLSNSLDHNQKWF